MTNSHPKPIITGSKSDPEQERITKNQIENLTGKKAKLVQSIKAHRFTLLKEAIFAVCGCAFGSLLYMAFGHKPLQYTFPDMAIWLIIPGFISLAICSFVLWGTQINLQNDLDETDRKLVQMGADELKENIAEDFFTKLVQINFTYIDKYYSQTQRQADKSFKLCSIAALAGLVIILLGIGMMFLNHTSPAYVTTASGMLGEFIAAVFFYLYNKTVLKMSEYHQKLVITQNISLALKITEGMDTKQKAEASAILIDRLTLDINKHLTDVKM